MSDEENKEEVPKFSKEALIQGLKENKYKKIVFMTGAGISVSAGIPDFRSPGTGLYDNLQKYNLPSPESIFTLDYFNEKPEAFYQLASEILNMDNFKPTPTHYFCKMVHDKGLVLKYMTQNIDNLEELAGWDRKDICQAHGANFGAHCGKCRKVADQSQLREHINTNKILYCQNQKCLGPVKPNITFFGEQLPEEFMGAFMKVKKADLLIVIGTALAVGPFNQIVNIIPDTIPKVLINMENTDYSGFQFDDQEKFPNRILLKGKCDDVINEVCSEVGWANDLEKLTGYKAGEKPDTQINVKELEAKLEGLDINKEEAKKEDDQIEEKKEVETTKTEKVEQKPVLTEDGERAPQVDAQAGPIMGFYACQPIKECPHCIPADNIAPIEEFKDLTVTTPCGDCGHTKENWVCLKCKVIMCSRYVKSHMVQHNEKEKHPIALSFADFSFWCYDCDSYVVSKHLNHVKHFYPQKFGDEDVGVIDQYQKVLESKNE